MIKKNVSSTYHILRILSVITLALLVGRNAHGLADLPFEKMVLTRVDPMQFSEGLCPGNPLRTAPTIFSPYAALPGNPLERWRRDGRHQLALKSSNAIYALPDLESAKSGRELVTQMQSFLTTLPEGYEFYFYVADPESGMKYMILAPIHEGLPWVLSISGTQSTIDWLVDLDLGRSQFEKIRKAMSLLTTCQFLDSAGLPLSAHEWIITGHSLGGGLAQALSYKIQSERLRNRLSPIRMEVITFNAFGAKELIAKSERVNDKIEASMNVTNYFVHSEPVSRIGTHFGITLQLTPPNEPLDVDIVNPFSLAGAMRHKIAAVIALASGARPVAGRLDSLSSSLSLAVERRPLKMGLINELIRFDSLVSMLPAAVFLSTARQSQILEKFKAAVAAAKEPGLANSEVVKSYIARLIFSQMMLIHVPPTGPMEQLRLDWYRQWLRELQD